MADDPEEPDAVPSEYEQLRLRNIARNNLTLERLGLVSDHT
jgi:hypothetical protein